MVEVDKQYQALPLAEKVEKQLSYYKDQCSETDYNFVANGQCYKFLKDIFKLIKFPDHVDKFLESKCKTKYNYSSQQWSTHCLLSDIKIELDKLLVFPMEIRSKDV